MRQAIVALSGYPRRWLGWSQYRVLGAAALDLCAVAAGQVDAFIDCACRVPGALGLPRRVAHLPGSRCLGAGGLRQGAGGRDPDAAGACGGGDARAVGEAVAARLGLEN